jgi:hypothetical protein
VCIVVGPRNDAAEDLISRFKSLFRENFPGIYSELIRQPSTAAILNGIRVEGFPSHHVDTMRGLDKVKCIMSDETDYYPSFQQKEVRAVMEGYICKPNSDPHIILVSTPKEPGGLLQTIELEQNSLYFKMFLTYEYGLEGPYPIYSKEQIERAKKSPDFPREYEGLYLGVIGNVFNTQSINNCRKIEYNPDLIIPKCKVSIGIDAGFGSQTGFTAQDDDSLAHSSGRWLTAQDDEKVYPFLIVVVYIVNHNSLDCSAFQILCRSIPAIFWPRFDC